MATNDYNNDEKSTINCTGDWDKDGGRYSGNIPAMTPAWEIGSKMVVGTGATRQQ